MYFKEKEPECTIVLKCDKEGTVIRLNGSLHELMAGVAVIIEKISERSEIPKEELLNGLILRMITEKPRTPKRQG